MAEKFDRRRFLQIAGAAASTASPTNEPASPGNAATPAPSRTSASRPADEPAYLAVAHGEDPAAITAAAIAAIGGMERFVTRGADVIVKPNVCIARSPEYAATTNPDVVAALVALALKAGAGRVRVMDLGFGSPMEDAYVDSGILKAVEGAGGSVEIMSSFKFVDTPIPQGRSIRSWRIYRDIMEADLVITVPIAKSHGSAVLTLGGKNLMGVIADPGGFHGDLGQRIADLVSAVRPALTVVDAYRILTRNGPTGGDLADVKQTRQVIASHDVVAADSYATTLLDMKATDIPYVLAMEKMDLGRADLRRVRIEEISL